MLDDCPRCGLHFEREEGYWLGAMMVNLGAAELAFVAVLVGMSVAYWPEVPWIAVFIVSVLVSVAVPLFFYPFSKTIWVAGDLLARPVNDHHRAGLRERPRDRKP